jgi:hypothetical protein
MTNIVLQVLPFLYLLTWQDVDAGTLDSSVGVTTYYNVWHKETLAATNDMGPIYNGWWFLGTTTNNTWYHFDLLHMQEGHFRIEKITTR